MKVRALGGGGGQKKGKLFSIKPIKRIDNRETGRKINERR
jgi:hypothetical protein